MKINIANPPNGTQKTIEVTDERNLRQLYDKRIGQEVSGSFLGTEYSDYVFKITGGNDKEGFPMKQGILLPHRVRILMGANTTCYRPRRSGERRRKSVRGCIVASDLSVLSVIVSKTGSTAIQGLTDVTIPRRLGPKRANNIRKLFNLTKKDDVRKYVIRREVVSKKEGKKPVSKAPKIQRLITPVTLQRKRARLAQKKHKLEKSKTEAAEYAKLVALRSKESREKKHALHIKKRAVSSA